MITDSKLKDATSNKNALIGHTSLCLMSLIGYFIYTASYSAVNQFKTTSSTKPVAVVEMWMVLTHLIASVVTCCIEALFTTSTTVTVSLSEAQTSLFLAVALAVTLSSAVCWQSSSWVACTAYFPAAIWPQVAAAGAMAWAWVMYVASLGCQISYISLGCFNKRSILTPVVLALFSPQILATFRQTCGIAAACPSDIQCNMALNITLVMLAFVLWTCAPFTDLELPLQFLATVLLIIDAVVVLSASAYFAWAVSLTAVCPLLSDIPFNQILFGYTLSSSSAVNYLHPRTTTTSSFHNAGAVHLAQQLHLH